MPAHHRSGVLAPDRRIMLITCSACAAVYTIDESRVGKAGRTVRCAQCRETWFVSPPVLDPEMPASASSLVPLDEPAAPAISPVVKQRGTVRRPPLRRPERGRPAQSWIMRHGATALAGLIVLAVPAAIPLRRSIVRAAPESARVFAAIGLPVNLVGLDLTDVTSGFTEEAAKRVLIVEGAIGNPGAHPLTVPPIQVAVEGSAGELLYAWSTRPPRPDLGPAETTRFRIRLASPPPQGRRVAVTFKTDAHGAAVASR